MSIEYVLRENLLTADPNDCMAQVVNTKSYSTDEIIGRMLLRGTTVTKTDALAIINLFFEECAAITAEGGSVNTELFTTSASITGVFASAEDSFDKNRHAVKLNVSAGTKLKTAIAGAKTAKSAVPASTDPYIVSISDSVSETADAVATGSAMRLTGSRLKFDKADSEQGVFVIQDGAEVRCTQVIENKPARVVVLLPQTVKSGEFTVEVRTKLDGTKTLKTLKKGAYRKSVTALAE